MAERRSESIHSLDDEIFDSPYTEALRFCQSHDVCPSLHISGVCTPFVSRVEQNWVAVSSAQLCFGSDGRQTAGEHELPLPKDVVAVKIPKRPGVKALLTKKSDSLLPFDNSPFSEESNTRERVAVLALFKCSLSQSNEVEFEQPLEFPAEYLQRRTPVW